MLPTTDGGQITLTTTYERNKNTDILLTKTDKNGNEVWFKRYGGSSYDKAADLIESPAGGYLILGSTSSYGKGNYDLYLVKVAKNGKKQWTKTFGAFYNDYGKSLGLVREGYIINATRQYCEDTDDPTPECLTMPWTIKVDLSGKKVWDDRTVR